MRGEEVLTCRVEPRVGKGSDRSTANGRRQPIPVPGDQAEGRRLGKGPNRGHDASVIFGNAQVAQLFGRAGEQSSREDECDWVPITLGIR